MVVVQGSKVHLPHPSSLSPSPHPLPTTSILFEPSSLSLALTHSDSSLSLYPSFSPFSPSQTLTLTLTIPSPSSSSTFLLLQNHTNPTSSVVKQTNVKLKHDNRDGGSCFVTLKVNEVKTKSPTKVSMSIKAISIQAVSQRMFLILDSHGDLHLLSLSNSGIGVDITGNVLQLPHIMKVRSLAVLPDLSTMSQTIWISDGCHSVHMFTAMDIENALNEADGNDCNEKLMHLPVIRVLFSSEKIQDIISLSANSILILGQGNIYFCFYT
ncbi:hypothetical protein glysoja_037755 [Glycine soja]|uniref:Uncharacterized protein n=1 Tax=Glycine soja TaxID=3848 RepID=A0A0B2ST03_GLYSO|nr:hypothetical protein glysoja_037755 [Glycine soja]